MAMSAERSLTSVERLSSSEKTTPFSSASAISLHILLTHPLVYVTKAEVGEGNVELPHAGNTEEGGEYKMVTEIHAVQDDCTLLVQQSMEELSAKIMQRIPSRDRP
ncbi:hypothetical protein B566_EDAN010952 [Ephemera danica]|nr:hypothetical protein B566_EDAN010952 [Ephemera danica]